MHLLTAVEMYRMNKSKTYLPRRMPWDDLGAQLEVFDLRLNLCQSVS
jgi:hypothetical protein